MVQTTIVRALATHRRDFDEHVFYALRLEHLDVGGLQAKGFDLVVEPLTLDSDDLRVKDAEMLSFFSIVREGWRAS